MPARIIQIDGTRARVDVLGNETETDLRLIEKPRVGDYVLIHAGFAIEKLPTAEAQQRLDLFKELIGDDA